MNGTSKNILFATGNLLGGIVLFGVIVFIPVIFLLGGAWASSKLLPLFIFFTVIVFFLDLLVFLPLAIFKATRGISSMALFLSSYLFGVTLWIEGLVITLTLWGWVAAVIGLFVLGVGVVPMALFATVMNGEWKGFWEMILLGVITFGARLIAISLAVNVEKQYQRKDIIDV